MITPDGIPRECDIVPRVETTSLFTLQTLLSTTDYVGMCSEAVAHHMQTLGLLSVLQLTESISFAPIGAVWRADRADATTRKFVDALRLSLIAPPR